MATSKTKIYNLSFSILLLARQTVDADTDINTNEVKALNTYWEDALTSSLQEMDLDSLSEPITLELLVELDGTGPWLYAYKYPSRCAFLRRIVSCSTTDTRDTFIDKRVQLYNGQKAIYTNEYQAVAECIPKDVSLDNLSPPATWAIAHKLAFLAAPLLTGKGAKALMESIFQKYQLFINDAQELDKLENYTYEPAYIASEYVRTRLS